MIRGFGPSSTTIIMCAASRGHLRGVPALRKECPAPSSLGILFSLLCPRSSDASLVVLASLAGEKRRVGPQGLNRGAGPQGLRIDAQNTGRVGPQGLEHLAHGPKTLALGPNKTLFP